MSPQQSGQIEQQLRKLIRQAERTRDYRCAAHLAGKAAALLRQPVQRTVYDRVLKEAIEKRLSPESLADAGHQAWYRQRQYAQATSIFSAAWEKLLHDADF